ncbi:MAG: hypothetical protein MJ200_01140 [Mycoplasmoidaceae bacterium]|nr:hypothetical protein [Mycoplasmoidaceae bacterium]
MKKLTDCEAAEAVPHNKSFKLQADGIKFNYLDGDVDTRLSSDDMSGSNFIALASYNVTIYKDSTKRSKNVAAMNGITGMLPAYWLDIYRNRTD